MFNADEYEKLTRFLTHYAKDVKMDVERTPIDIGYTHGTASQVMMQGEQTVTVQFSMHALKKLVHLEEIAGDCLREERIRHNNNAARQAWEHYQTLLKLVQ